jgi:hypothetical protein
MSALKPDKKDLGPVFMPPLISLACALFLLVTTRPYFLSSAVLFTHNPVDEAIVDAIGAGNVKPLLLLLLFFGGLVGLTNLIPLRNLFQSLAEERHIALTMKRLHFYMFYPFLGMLTAVISALVERLGPWASLVDGALIDLLFNFPGFGFMLSASVVHFVLYYGLKSKAKERGQRVAAMYYYREKSYCLELVDTH